MTITFFVSIALWHNWVPKKFYSWNFALTAKESKCNGIKTFDTSASLTKTYSCSWTITSWVIKRLSVSCLLATSIVVNNQFSVSFVFSWFQSWILLCAKHQTTSFSTKKILRTTPVMLLLGLTPWLLTKLCCVSSQRHWDRWPGTVPTQRGKLQELRQIATNGCVSLIWNSTYYDVVLCWPTYWFIFLGINLIGPWPTCCTWLAVDCHLVAIWSLYLVCSIIPVVSLPIILPQGGFPLALWGSLFPH